MKSKVLLGLLLAGILAVNPVFSNLASAEEKVTKPAKKAVKKAPQKATSRMQKTRGSGPIPNLTLLNEPQFSTAAPPAKGNLLTKAEVCSLHVTNNTDYIVHISVDNQPRMSVYSLGTSSASFAGSEHTIVGTAYFKDGSTGTFGPIEVADCKSNYDWDLAR